ncbi:hypothetical protein ACHAQF_003896 [Verticillium nonalfalfae]
MSDVYRKTGRGGAGNFYSKQDIEQAEQAKATDDLEAQKVATNTSTVTASTAARDAYARAGRGGAGNFHDPATLPAAREQEAAADRTRTAVNASIARAANKGYSGRGGAGNWTSKEDEAAKKEEEALRVEALERKVVEDVESGLAMPPRAHAREQNGQRQDEV